MKTLLVLTLFFVLAFCAEPDCQNCILTATEVDRIIKTDPSSIGGFKTHDI
jgi:hypothetical protein